MIRILIGCLLMVTTAFATPTSKLEAILSKDVEISFMRHRPKSQGKIFFPENSYNVRNMTFFNLKCIKCTNQKYTSNEVLEHCVLATTARLELVYYDSITKKYKFKLIITPKVINNNEMLMVSGPKKVPLEPYGTLIFKDSNLPYTYLEGIADVRNDKLTLLNIHTDSSNSSFELSVSESSNNLLTLKPLKTIHIIVNING